MRMTSAASGLLLTSFGSQCARNRAYRLSAARQIFGERAQVLGFIVENALKAAGLLSLRSIKP